MTKVPFIIFALFLLSFTGCDNGSSAPTQNTTTNAPAPTASPSTSPTLSVAPTLATPSPGNTVAPTVAPNAKGDNKQAKGEQKAFPPEIWDRMTRPLTREQIDKLPPETRDMILRAQGKLQPSPSPSPKKK